MYEDVELSLIKELVLIAYDANRTTRSMREFSLNGGIAPLSPAKLNVCSLIKEGLVNRNEGRLARTWLFV